MNRLSGVSPDEINHHWNITGDLVSLIVGVVVADRWRAFPAAAHICHEHIKSLFSQKATQSLSRFGIENLPILNGTMNHQYRRSSVILMDVSEMKSVVLIFNKDGVL